MCVSVSGSTPSYNPQSISNQELNERIAKNLKNEPLNLNLPDIHNPLSNSDSMKFTPIPNSPSIPVYGNDDKFVRLTEYGSNSAKFEIGNPGEKPLVTLKARNEGIHGENSKLSVNSPYLRDKARDYAKDTIMDNVVTPLRETMGKTVADTTLVTAVVATAVISAKHLPDGHGKIDIPIQKLTGDSEIRTKLIVGYGNGSNIKATGMEISDKYKFGNNKEMEVKLSHRKDAEVNGVKGTSETRVEAVIVDARRRWDDGVISASVGHNNVTGTTASLFYHKQF